MNTNSSNVGQMKKVPKAKGRVCLCVFDRDGEGKGKPKTATAVKMGFINVFLNCVCILHCREKECI